MSADWTAAHRAALVAQVASTWALVGLIWLVQVVHYPLFERVAADAFAAFHRAHGLRISWVVMPLMLVELATALWWLWRRPPGIPAWLVWLGASLVAVIWLSTFAVQVPEHQALADGFDASAHRRLVAGNWIRTVAWSGRGALLAWLLAKRLL